MRNLVLILLSDTYTNLKYHEWFHDQSRSFVQGPFYSYKMITAPQNSTGDRRGHLKVYEAERRNHKRRVQPKGDNGCQIQLARGKLCEVIMMTNIY